MFSPILGASGGVCGLAICAALWRPYTVLLPIPVLMNGRFRHLLSLPTYLCVLTPMVAMLSMDLMSLLDGEEDGVGHGAHLGGAAVGVLAFKALRHTVLKH